MNTVEKWGIFEVSLKGPSAGNPFTEQSVSATFRSKNEIVTVDGFYDGDGVYKVRFMPSSHGEVHVTGRSGGYGPGLPAISPCGADRQR